MFRSGSTLLRKLLLLVLLGVLGLMAYEGWRVLRAQALTPDYFAEYQDDSYAGLRWSDLSARQQAILIAVEDPAFFTHRGFDLSTPGAGKTTITQALVKRLYFDPFRPGFAKLEQSLIARFAVEAQVPKEAILTAFLDQSWFGEGQTGFAAAAEAQFGKPVNQLTETEFIALVARLVGPAHYTPGSDALAERSARIARLLAGDCAAQSNGDVYYENC